MRKGTDGQAHPYVEIASSLGPIRWKNLSTPSEVIAHPEKQYLRQSDYLVQYINLLFGDTRFITDTEERKNLFLDAYVMVGGSKNFIKQVGDVVENNRFGPDEDWRDGYAQYWFDMASLYGRRSMVDVGGHNEFSLLEEKISGSKKMQWIHDCLSKIETIDGARDSGTQLYNIAYDIAPAFGVDADVGSWRDGIKQAYEDFVSWVVESKI